MTLDQYKANAFGVARSAAFTVLQGLRANDVNPKALALAEKTFRMAVAEGHAYPLAKFARDYEAMSRQNVVSSMNKILEALFKAYHKSSGRGE